MSGVEKTICVIVVNWNNAEDTMRCLESLSGVSFPDFKTIVVDNGSTDGSTERIRERYPGCGLLEP